MVIGRISGAFGIRGELKVELFTDYPDRFKALSAIFVGQERQQYDVVGARRHKNMVLLRLAGVDSPDSVDTLRGQELFVPRSQSVTLKKDEYFFEDMIGVEALAESGASIGHVSDVLRTGSNDVFVVRGSGREILVPATREAVQELDLDVRRMVVAAWVLQEPL
ncbi:MAG TPA: ribosome maturation factor RimM [Chloroflexota bacterium]